MQLLGISRIFSAFVNFSQSSLSFFASLCIRRTFLGAVARPRSHPAALGGGQRLREGGEAAPRGESLRDCERQRRPGALVGRWDGFLLTVWRLFCLLNVETSHGEVMIKGF